MGKYGRKSVIYLTVAIFRENMFWGLPTRLMKVLFNYMKKKRLPVPTHISSWALRTFLEIAQDSISCPCHARTHHYYAYLAQPHLCLTTMNELENKASLAPGVGSNFARHVYLQKKGAQV